ncbi:MAG TPA: M48 family metalloprotease [Chthoniobacteraceae bacterium]|nr:M48 family metalloprotease [Chthoniobacteraceae bacterium]
MSETIPQTPASTPLAPPPYLHEVVALLKEREPELWQWSSSVAVRSEASEEARTELLKANYRLDAAGHPELTERCAAVAQRLGVTAPITLYQANGGFGLNAMLCYLPGEAHIVFTGPILANLRGAELDAVLAHELAHYQLWTMNGGEFLVADRLLMAAADDARASTSHAQTARRFRLYTEVFADRGGFAGCGELEATVAALVKTETGLHDVSAASYLRQADEIFAREESRTKGLNHPETFIRARALRLWAEQDADVENWLAATIEGPLGVDELDLVGQQRLTKLTRRFLGEFLRPKWFQSAAVLAHARGFFPDFAVPSTPDAAVADELQFTDAASREYLCYLLLDFVAIDPDLEEVPLAAALEWSGRLGIGEAFSKLAMKELGLGKRVLARVKKEAEAMLKEPT